MWKSGSQIIHKTQILSIQSSLWLHLQPYLQAINWKKRKKSIKLFSLWTNPTLQESKISLTHIYESILPPWTIKKPKVILNLKRTPPPQKKNPSQHIPGEIPKYPPTTTNSRFHILTWNSKSINFFTQNSNNAGIITSTTNSSRSSPLWENGDQLLENWEENKSLYLDCALITQDLLFNTQTGTTVTVFDMSNALHR